MFVSGAGQLGHSSFSEILIIRAYGFRHIHKFYIYGLIERSTDGTNEIDEGSCMTGTQVEDSADLRPACQPEHDSSAILHIDEVAQLLSIGEVIAIRFEE